MKTPFAQITKRFTAVRLAELVEDAALLTRVDRKYLLPAEDAARAIEEVDPGTRILDIDGERSFSYASVYFDTPDRLSYRLAAQPRRRRFKLRTRAYLGSGTAYLEMKTRGGRGTTVKDRIPYRVADLDRLTPEGRRYVGAALETIGLDPALVTALHPSLTTRYRRTTLLAPSGSRATIDTELSWVDASGDVISLPEHTIVESKSAGPATEIDRALWRLGHRPQSISKFGTGTAAFYPELPRNKWARILRGPFARSEPVASDARPHLAAPTHPDRPSTRMEESA